MPTILTLFSAVMRKLTPPEVDANFTALRTTADAAGAAAAALGGFSASQTPAANQIPVLSSIGSLPVGKFVYPEVTTQKTPTNYSNSSGPVYETFKGSSGDFLGLGVLTGVLMSIGGNYASNGFQEATIMSGVASYGGIRRYRRVATSATTWGAWTGADVAGSAPLGIAFPATQALSSDPNTLDDYREASYTATATGMTTSPTGTVSFVKAGNSVTISLPEISGTSNATTFTLTGMPTTCRPSADRYVAVRAGDNGGALSAANAKIDSAGTVTIYRDMAGSPFTATGTKVLGKLCISYTI